MGAIPAAAGVSITAPAAATAGTPQSVTAPAAPGGYEWVGWQHSGAVGLVSGSDWTTPTINVYVTGTGASVVAEYKESIRGIMVNGTEWATTNLSGVGTFAANSWDYGYYFTFADAQTACPAPWRLPTKAEFEELISDTYTTRSWTAGTGATNGLRVEIKATGEVIYFGNNGYKSSAAGAARYVGTNGYSWSSSASGSTGYDLYFNSGRPAGGLSTYNKSGLFSVRCVKD